MESLSPLQPLLSAFRALLPMHQRKREGAVVNQVRKSPEVSLPPAVPMEAAVQQRERDTMYLHPITVTTLLRVDAIPIHPARKYPPGETHGVVA